MSDLRILISSMFVGMSFLTDNSLDKGALIFLAVLWLIVDFCEKPPPLTGSEKKEKKHGK